MRTKSLLIFLGACFFTTWFLIEHIVKTKSLEEQAKPYVLSWDTPNSPIYYPVIPGSDVAMPFGKPYKANWRPMGFAKLVFVSIPGTKMKDRRLPSLLR